MKNIVKLLLMIFAAYFGLTGLYIFLAPETFYQLTPGLADMGPYNFHFIRDVSLTFLVCGLALAYGAWKQLKPVLIFGAAWPFLHALFHLQIWGHRGFPVDHIFVVDAFGVILPGFLALALALKFKPNIAN